MSFGERAAIEGVVAQLRPRLAIEIGTAEGGSLARIATHSERVVSFDLVEPEEHVKALANVELRTGDSHALLAPELQRLAAEGETVDFVLVDGDHTAAGARSDMEDVLASEAVRRTVILAHDSLNPEVRRGLEEVDYSAHEKVAWVEMDFVGGYVPAEAPLRGECWGGLALVIVDADRGFGDAHQGRRPEMEPLSNLVWGAAERLREPSGNGAAAPNGDRAKLEALEGSLSWRVTAPLRALSARLRNRR